LPTALFVFIFGMAAFLAAQRRKERPF